MKITKDQFLELYEKNYIDRRIAEHFGVHAITIGIFRKKLGLPTVNRLHIYYNKVLELNNQGHSDPEISKILGLSKSFVQYVRSKYQIKSNFIERTYSNIVDRKKGYIIRNSKFQSRRRGIPFDLTYEDLELPSHCPILGIQLEYFNTGNSPNHYTLDRIDNTKGYIKGNVIIMSRLANAMKNEANFEQLRCFSKNINKLIDHYENHGALGSITDVFPDTKMYGET